MLRIEAYGVASFAGAFEFKISDLRIEEYGEAGAELSGLLLSVSKSDPYGAEGFGFVLSALSIDSYIGDDMSVLTC